MRNQLGRPGLEPGWELDGAGKLLGREMQAGPWLSHKVGRRGDGEDGSVQTRSQSELLSACRYCSRRALDDSKRQDMQDAGIRGSQSAQA